MKIVEIKGRIAADGSILLPPGVLESMSMTIGEGCIVIGSTDPVCQLPPQLLELFADLGISPDTVRSVMEGGGEDE